MKLFCYSVRDNAVEAYAPPFFARAPGEALRMFMNTATDDKSQIARSPVDYTLFLVGHWDDQSGLFTAMEPVRVICAAEIGEKSSA